MPPFLTKVMNMYSNAAPLLTKVMNMYSKAALFHKVMNLYSNVALSDNGDDYVFQCRPFLTK